MKKIKSINQYLLEHYPLVWNTKLLWISLIAIAFHLIFFIIGFFTIYNPEQLQTVNIIDNFFNNGIVFISIIISILLIMCWLVYYFKNNAFKSLYPFSSKNLFLTFFYQCIIIFISITFYYSYTFGLTSKIKFDYPLEEINSDINLTNKSSVFFSHAYDRYTLNNKYFEDISCKVSMQSYNLIDTQKPYLYDTESFYQFYNQKIINLGLKDISNKYEIEQTYNTFYKNYLLNINFNKDHQLVLILVDSIYDLKSEFNTTKPSYYNYSFKFHDSITLEEKIRFRESTISENEISNKESTYYVNNNIVNVLNKNNKKEIKNHLSSFLKLCKKYKIKTDLTTESWFKLVYYPEFFELKNLILTQKPRNDTYGVAEYNYNYKNVRNDDKEKYSYINRTQHYIETENLDNIYDNIDDAYNDDYYSTPFLFFLWISIGISLLIFMFKTTGLKPLIFSIVAAGLIIIGLSLFSFLFISNLVMYISFIILLLILLFAIFFKSSGNKLFKGVLINLGLVIFPILWTMMFSIYDKTMNDKCGNNYTSIFNDYFYLINIFIMLITFVFIYLFSKKIRYWKALPSN